MDVWYAYRPVQEPESCPLPDHELHWHVLVIVEILVVLLRLL
jgi:hypothetical protein